MPPITVLLADDHTLFRQGLRHVCKVNGGFKVVGDEFMDARIPHKKVIKDLT